MNLVILTGAGISADSGVATFRDADGIWAQNDWRDVATPEGFARDPERVHAFYNARRAALPGVTPNPAHVALADLEARCRARGIGFTLVTQNVDDLHERAGSAEPLAMHGRLDRVRCVGCEEEFTWTAPLTTGDPCPSCDRTGTLRPAVVWFGEMPRLMDEIGAALASATHFAAIGTSGTVYPAAGLAAEARSGGAATTLINLEPADNAADFDEHIYGPAAEVVPAWTTHILTPDP